MKDFVKKQFVECKVTLISTDYAKVLLMSNGFDGELDDDWWKE